MDNPGFTGDTDKRDEGKLQEATDGNIQNGLDAEKKEIPEVYRYSAENKALEAMDNVMMAVDVGPMPADKPYAGMGKEDLLRFSQTPFWNRFRNACTIIFWLAWLGLLVAVIVLTVTFPQCKPPPEKQWYETSTFYQIYVRSFYDSDGDGVGDINGIRSKLAYIDSINVDAIILSSMYVSEPDVENGGTGLVDYGYEVLDHELLDETYGTLAEFDALLKEAHDLDIKVIMDFIPNYTGIRHPWFISSSADGSTGNPYWNYYVWADCGTTGVPNNWLSVYSEPMWKASGSRGLGGGDQCYLHQFLETQPELNLRSAAVQAELEGILHYWLGRGVDGFRVDKVMHLFEDADLGNETSTCSDMYDCYGHEYTTAQDEIYPLVEKWRAILDEYISADGVPRVLLTDAMGTVNKSLMYYGKYGPDGAQLPLNFQLTQINTNCNGKCVFNLVDDWLYGTPTFATADWMTGTQNLARLADIIPQDNWDHWGYQNAVTLLKMTLPGAPIMYYGEEIGMTSVNSTMTDPRDPAGQLNYDYSRDPYRSPMQWDNGSNAGFVNESAYNSSDMTMEPWLPVGDNTFNISVEAQNGTEFSPYMFYTEIASLRRTSETFYVGNFHYTLLTDELISYYREYEGKDRYLIAINFGPGSESMTFDIAGSHYDIPGSAEVVMTTRADMSVSPGDSADLGGLSLSPGDGVMVKWEYVRPDGKPSSM